MIIYPAFLHAKEKAHTHQNRPGLDFVFSSREEVLKLKSLEPSGNNFRESTGNE